MIYVSIRLPIATIASKKAVFYRIADRVMVTGIVPNLDEAIKILGKLEETLDFPVSTASRDSFLAAVTNKDNLDWGLSGSTRGAKNWIFYLETSCMYVGNDLASEDLIGNHRNQRFSIHQDFLHSWEVLNLQTKRIERSQRTITIQPVPTGHHPDENPLTIAVMSSLCDSSRQSPGDVVLTTLLYLDTIMLKAGLENYCRDIHASWFRTFVKTKSTEGPVDSRKTGAKEPRKVSTSRPAETPPDLEPPHAVDPRDTLRLTVKAGPMSERIMDLVSQALTNDSRGVVSNLDMMGYLMRCSAGGSANNKVTDIKPAECHPWGVVFAARETGLTHLMGLLLTALKIPEDHIIMVGWGNRPDAKSTRLKHQRDLRVMFMVDSSSVLSHILAAFRSAKQWVEQFHLNDASAILGKTGILPRISNSFVHGTAVGPPVRICNANEHTEYNLSPSTVWDMLDVVATRTVKDLLPQTGQGMLSKSELRAQRTQRDAADADRPDGGEDEFETIVPHRHLQQLRASVNHIAATFPAARGSHLMLEVLGPLMAPASLDEVRLMLLRIIPLHPRATQQLLYDMDQVCNATIEAAGGAAVNAAEEDMEDGEIREPR
jgi:hypothetical protein